MMKTDRWSNNAETSPLSILFIGELTPGSTSLQRFQALKEIGHHVVGVDMFPQSLVNGVRGLAYRACHKFHGPIDMYGANKKALSLSQTMSPKIVWIEKGLTIRKSTLTLLRDRLPTACFIFLSLDDMMNPNNQSIDYLASIPFYDLHVTTKSFNVQELKAHGARNVLMIDNGFCASVHRPIQISAEDRRRLGGPVGFIGMWQEARAKSMTFLAEHGVPIRVWGWGPWKRFKSYHENIQVEGRPLWGDEYARGICSFDINLCFLSKANRDLQTTRSIEIPACAGFMLGERTSEHLQLFGEGKEAEFFSSDQELLDKVVYYLRHEEERRRIALAGYQRCMVSGYSYHDRLRCVVEEANKIVCSRDGVGSVAH